MEKKKKKQPLKPLHYLTGSPMDNRAAMSALKFFLCGFGLMVGFLILGTMMMWDNLILRLVMNALLLLFAYGVYWQAGVSAGATAVNQGEILYQRQATGRDVDPKELTYSYHAAKGFLTALIGSVPILLCALILALTAQRVLTTAGALPSWLETLERRDEIGAALASYHQSEPLGLTDAMRVIIRMMIMPLINMVGVENRNALLLLERLSPLLVLIPGLCYGVGYLGGVSVRSKVHADIEAGKRKIKNRQKREQKQRRQRDKGPGQLN